jgi:hypothetical protein
MGPTGCPETSITNYQSTLRNIPEERVSRLRRGGSVKSRKYSICLKRSQTAKHYQYCMYVLRQSGIISIACMCSDSQALSVLHVCAQTVRHYQYCMYVLRPPSIISTAYMCSDAKHYQYCMYVLRPPSIISTACMCSDAKHYQYCMFIFFKAILLHILSQHVYCL